MTGPAASRRLTGPTAAILLIGDELLSGKVRDENAAFLTRELRALGVVTRRIEVVPDAADEIAEAVRRLSAAHDHLFTAGGVGATHDDVTLPAVALAFGQGLRRDPELVERIRAGLGPAFHERELRMADVPAGARLLRGPADTSVWPVVAVGNVYVLPGVPAILQRKFALLRELLASPPIHTGALFVDATEGQIADRLDQVVAAHAAVAIGSYPHLDARDYQVKITFDARDPDALAAAMDDLGARLGPAVVRRG